MTVISRHKKLISVITVFLFALSGLFAASTITVGPSINYQHIFYNYRTYPEKRAFGPGFFVSYDYDVIDSLILDSTVSYEYEPYKDFYKYHDLKISINATILIVPTDMPDAKVKLHATMGCGVDLVFRNDGDFGLYFLNRVGLIMDIRLSCKTVLCIRPVIEITLQKGSFLIHSSLGVGAAFKLRGSR